MKPGFNRRFLILPMALLIAACAGSCGDGGQPVGATSAVSSGSAATGGAVSDSASGAGGATTGAGANGAGSGGTPAGSTGSGASGGAGGSASGGSASGGSSDSPAANPWVDPDDMPGASDREKIIAGARQAVAKGVPLRLNRIFVTQRIEFRQEFNGLVIEGNGAQTGFRMVDVPDRRDIAWGWLLHFNPDPGTTMLVKLRNFSVDGNRDHPDVRLELQYNPTTQWGIVADGHGYTNQEAPGYLTLELEKLDIFSFDGSGMVMIGDKAIVKASDLTFRYMGGSGMDGTRGKFFGERIDSGYNAGIQINMSSLAFGWVKDSRAHHGGRAHPKAGKAVHGTPSGGGIKISLRPDGTNPPVFAQLDNVVIEDNVGTGLTSTSAGTNGQIFGGRITFRRNGDSAINLTDGAHIEATELLCEDGLRRYASSDIIAGLTQRPLDANSSDLLLFGGGRAHFGSVTVRRSLGFGLNGGWGTSLEARTMLFENNSPAHGHLRFVGPGTNVKIDELTLKGTGGSSAELVSTAVVGKTTVLP